ncbi:MAG: U32 family peptidase [Clostridia bacterium]|nr:U32 family peptidase [Clostridia bacterium]
MCEILAPCGDKNTAFTAINSGADAIYLGLTEFSARDSAVNFSFEDLRETINFASYFGVKVYVAMNTLVKNGELKSFFDTVCKVWGCGADAIILQDIFLGKYIKERCPQIVLHLSTQAGVCNEYAALVAKEYGFSRVILSRETSLCDIAKITKIIETEVFVQGALCTCFSGQCYFSSFVGGNSGNRGRCKQPCRKLYSIDRKGYENPAYRLSLSDLFVSNRIKDLIVAGVKSFKIEGRMRRPEYVAAAVNYYRNIIDGKDGNLSDLKRTYNRGNYTCGLAFGQDKNFISSVVQGHLGEFIGVISVKNGNYVCHSSSYKPVNGDCFKILRCGKEVCGATFAKTLHDGFTVSCDKKLYNGDKVFITTDVRLKDKLLSQKRYIDVNLSAEFIAGERARVTVNGNKYYSDDVLQVAQNRALSFDDVTACFDKVDGRPFKIIYGDIVIKGSPYIGMAALNAFRRDVYNKFSSALNNKSGRSTEIDFAFPAIDAVNNCKKAVIAQNLNGVSADIGILKPYDYFADLSALIKDFNGEKYLYLPPYLSGAETEKLKQSLKIFDGIYCEGIYGISLAKELGMPLFAGVGFNITNSISASLVPAKYYCISKELTVKESEPLYADKAFYLAGGGIKVMDLVYCPFSRTCNSCDKRNVYTLTDEENRQFPLKRYKTSECRFELYNCAELNCAEDVACGSLYDYTLQFKADNFTRGHTRTGVK